MVKTRKKPPTLARPKKKKAASKRAEVSALGQAIRALGGLGGGYLGGPQGAAVGSSLGAALSRWLGSGDYHVSNNTVINKAASGIPMMHKDGQSIIVRHKEMLTEIRGNSTFTVTNSFVLNPGLSQTFPWLSRLANCFQEYTIKGMVFHYVPTSGTFTGGTASLGSVMMQTSYRSTDTAPASKVELLNEYCSNESVPSEPFAHPIECDPKENPFNVQYVRGGPVPAGETQLMYDLGTTHVAVSGCPSNTAVLGDLWVTYEVELRKPILDSNVTTTPSFYAEITLTGDVTTGALPASGTSVIGNLPISCTPTSITIPSGYFGYFTFYLEYRANATLTLDVSGNPSYSGVLVGSLNETFSRLDLVVSALPANRTAVFGFRCYKPNRDVAGVITLPIPAKGAGSVSLVVVQCYGTPD